VGVNPADNLAAVLFAHRDRKTLAWSDEPLMALPPKVTTPVDVPPWWRMKKKNAMFYDGAGRGDQARIMMTASTLCTDDVPDAQAIDAYFGDVRAYILSLEPPPYPLAVDATLAARGQGVFESRCAECHGTYGADATYPNFLIPVGDVGTDPTIASGAAQFADRFVQWFASSFYGKTARLDPQPAYYAPPLDGIWATAPYLHNGSVPTIELVLNSRARPRYWKRVDFDSTHFDEEALGWPFEEVPYSQDDAPEAERKLIYDTTKLSQSNAGHPFGDHLTDEQRRAVIEYLKTL